jgi:hypothetical protein
MNDNIIPLNPAAPKISDIEQIDAYIDLALGPKATELMSGVTLYTKDGATLGNAIVIGQTTPSSEAMADWLVQTKQRLWLVETDFGNKMKLTDREVDAYFTLGRQQDYQKWALNRWEKINGGPES